jgi:hypothetical protein
MLFRNPALGGPVLGLLGGRKLRCEVHNFVL